MYMGARTHHMAGDDVGAVATAVEDTARRAPDVGGTPTPGPADFG
jgi:hypothetical protein